MSRPLRLEFPGSVWHLTNRGVEQRTTFLDDADCLRFLRLLGSTVTRFKWLITAYVLMTNHFHLCVELTRPDTLSRGMQWLEGRYAQYFNQRYGRRGSLFQDRFDGQIIQKECYFQNVTRYVVLNPVRARMVPSAADYRWSSYRATAGLAERPSWLAVDALLDSFAIDREVARAEYRTFVASGLDHNPWQSLRHQIFLGTEEWATSLRESADAARYYKEIPREQRRVGLPSISRIVEVVGEKTLLGRDGVIRRGSRGRMVAAWLGFYEGLLTNSEIAEGVGLRSGGTVTNLVKQCDAELQENQYLKAVVDECLSTLRGTKVNSKT